MFVEQPLALSGSSKYENQIYSDIKDSSDYLTSSRTSPSAPEWLQLLTHINMMKIINMIQMIKMIRMIKIIKIFKMIETTKNIKNTTKKKCHDH